MEHSAIDAFEGLGRVGLAASSCQGERGFGVDPHLDRKILKLLSHEMDRRFIIASYHVGKFAKFIKTFPQSLSKNLACDFDLRGWYCDGFAFL